MSLGSSYSSHCYSPTSSNGQPETAMLRVSRSEDWDPYRQVITQLYGSMRLKDVMREMQERYYFKATEKQYKTQIKKWNLDTKYTKAAEYMAMIKARNMRERQTPGKRTKFVLRGKEVDPKDIARFEKRAMKKGIVDFDKVPVDEELLTELAYGTPSPPSPSPANPATSVEAHGYSRQGLDGYVCPAETVRPTGYSAYPVMEVGVAEPINYHQRR